VANLGHRPGKLESHGNEALKARLSGLLNRAFSAGPLSASLTWGAERFVQAETWTNVPDSFGCSVRCPQRTGSSRS
jgi:hypothetical protein